MTEPCRYIYALGAKLHRILTHHDAANNKPSIFSFPPVRTLRPDVSVAFEQVIMRALAPALEQRWPNAGEMEKAIINLPPITVPPPLGPLPAQGQSRPPNPQTPSNPSRNTTPGPAGGQIIAALGFMNANRVEEAYAAIQQAYALEPNNSLVHRTFGQVFA